ncbi:MAG: NAD(P)H-binding protein [Flavobacteriales bacterium]|nr:NAD(P)H-binding protein [Flavobacteriales bacterium]
MKAALAGSAGFIGTHLIDLLRSDKTFAEIDVLSRRELELPKKFNMLVGDVSKCELENPIDVAFCALGTTMATAGSKEAFYHVDHDMVIQFAEKAKRAGVQTFVLVSSLGADASSSNYYLNVKGETEKDLERIGFNSLVILRPSMLLGERKDFRLGELIGKGAMTLFDPFMLGGLKKYRGIHGLTVAKAMLKLAKENLTGVHILESDALQAFA